MDKHSNNREEEDGEIDDLDERINLQDGNAISGYAEMRRLAVDFSSSTSATTATNTRFSSSSLPSGSLSAYRSAAQEKAMRARRIMENSNILKPQASALAGSGEAAQLLHHSAVMGMPPPPLPPPFPPPSSMEGTEGEGDGSTTTTRRKRRWDVGPNGEAAQPLSSTSTTAATTDEPAAAVPAGKKKSRWDVAPPGVPPTVAPPPPLPFALPFPPPSVPPPTQPPFPPPPALFADSTAPAPVDPFTKLIEELNRPLTDAELDAMLPSQGYVIVPPPEGYARETAPAAIKAAEKKRLLAAPEAGEMDGAAPKAFVPPPENLSKDAYGIDLETDKGKEDVAASAPPTVVGDLPPMKEEDKQFFAKLITAKPKKKKKSKNKDGGLEEGEDEEDEEEEERPLSQEEMKERVILTLLLKIKNGLPAVRKLAMRQITDDAPRLGAGPLFEHLLPLLMSPVLDEQERHLLVKVVGRLLERLGSSVQPFAARIAAVMQPLLVDEDHFARREGREVLAGLASAVGLPTMIATLHPDVDNADEYVRNAVARAFAVVAGACGLASIVPFLRALCRSKRSWLARQTGMRLVQQIAVLQGCGALPHMDILAECAGRGLKDEQTRVRSAAAAAMATLAEAAHPYGYESFHPWIDTLWGCVASHSGKLLSAFLRALGSVILLMDPAAAAESLKRATPILVREFKSPDVETKATVLRVARQFASSEGATPTLVREELLPGLFEHFWQRRTALERKTKEAVLETTVAFAKRVGPAVVLERLVSDLRDDNEPYRRMVVECVEEVVGEVGLGDVSARLEERMVDGLIFAFQEQDRSGSSASEDGSTEFIRQYASKGKPMLRALVVVIERLGVKARPYLPTVCATAKYLLSNKAPAVRAQAADLIAGLAPSLGVCEEETLLNHLGVALFENLGEEYPDVLAAILKALNAVLAAVGPEKMTPPIRDLLPRLTPILRNTNDRVAESLIALIGSIARGGASHVPAREWMRICFELLELLRSPKLSIRKVATTTFGFIARAVGPQDVLHTLLNNLRVQERQMRVCTTVAIAIVAETCAPFTVLPGLMNEYRFPDTNVQNGVLKSLSFLLQYVGSAANDYVFALTPLLEDALCDRDHVHRQIASDAVKHLALGVAGMGAEESLAHLLNCVFPNIFEEAPHISRSVLECVESFRVALGPGVMMNYLLAGLFHPAHFVRAIYWRLYNNLYVYGADAMVPYYPHLDAVVELDGSKRDAAKTNRNMLEGYSSVFI